jgi:hypothetical protein
MNWINEVGNFCFTVVVVGVNVIIKLVDCLITFIIFYKVNYLTQVDCFNNCILLFGTH